MTNVKIDSTDLIHWADRHPSRGALPELVRRLLRQREPVCWIDMPCGDSTGKPGWDGIVTAGAGGHFAPEGLSCWEMGTSGDAADKANGDYRTRTEATPPERRAATAFVFVTPRRWPGKRGWIDAKSAEGAWREVRAYDADDLERWLDELPPVARWFAATQLGRKDVEDWVDPVIGWDDGALSLDRNELSWLTWRARLTPLFGRHAERAELLRWAREGGGVSFRFLIGDGGTGKTRLAHEIADELARDPEGRAAGLVPADRPLPLDAGRAGCFLLVDYPEEKRDAVRARLLQLANEPHDPARAVRVLFLTRNDDRYWGPLTDDTGAHTRMAPPIHLRPGLEPGEAWALFQSALERVPRKPGTPEPTGIDEAAFTEWLERVDAQGRRVEANQRPLLVAAAAIQAVADPARPVFTLDARAVIDALARRESARLRRLALAHTLPEHALERLTALAAVGGGLAEPQMRALADPALDLNLGEAAGLHDRIAAAGCLKAGRLPSPEPDIVAAAYLYQILAERPERAPDWLWTVIAGGDTTLIERLGRLTWDGEVMLGLRDFRVSDALARMARGEVERCAELEGMIPAVHLPTGLNPLAATVCLTLVGGPSPLGSARSPGFLQRVVLRLRARLSRSHRADLERLSRRAARLSDASVRLSAVGDGAGALAAIGEAVAVYRRLSVANPARYEPDLALSLNNLSTHRSEAGDGAGALAAIGDAVAVHRRLLVANPTRYEPHLAMSLNNLSNRLSEAGDGAGALAAIGEAVTVYGRLSAANPARYEPDLAMSLNNQSLRLSDAGDGAGALAAIGEAVAVYRRLSVANPARYEPDLASSLNNLSSDLSSAGDGAGALAAIGEAVAIRRRLSAANPARYEPDLADSLNNLSVYLSDAGDGAGALAAIGEAVAIRRRLSVANPARYEPDLAMSLNNLSSDLSVAGDGAGALAAIGEAVAIRRRLSAANPARYEPDLAMSLNNLSNRLSDAGDGAGALAAIGEAVAVYRRLSAVNPERYAHELAGSLANLAHRMDEAGQREEAVTLMREAVELIAPMARDWPDAEPAKWLRLMQEALAEWHSEAGA